MHRLDGLEDPDDTPRLTWHVTVGATTGFTWSDFRRPAAKTPELRNLLQDAAGHEKGLVPSMAAEGKHEPVWKWLRMQSISNNYVKDTNAHR